MSKAGNGNGDGGKAGGGLGLGLRMDVKQACTVLYSRLPPLDALVTERILSRIVGPCTVEWARSESLDVPMVGGVARFGGHEIAMIALNAPVSAAVRARTVEVSPMPEEQRARLMQHRAAIRLLYTRGSDLPAEQLTALYQVATALLSQGGLGILNERAALAQPIELLAEYLPIEPSEPLPMTLWVGMVTFDLGGDEAQGRFLMRTYGMEQFGLPELGAYTESRSQADAVYRMLLNVGLYLVESSAQRQIGPGHRADFNGHIYLFTTPEQHSIEFGSRTGLLMLVEV